MGVKHTYRWYEKNNRLKTIPRTESLSPLKAINRFCYQCMGFCEDTYHEVQNCTAPDCALYPFRMGVYPKGYRDLSPESREKAVKSLEKARKAKLASA